jgi:transposase
MSNTTECPNCRRLQAELEALKQRVQQLERALEEALRAGKRQAAPFSKGLPKADPKPPGRKAGEAYGRHAHRAPPKEFDEAHEAPLPPVCSCCGGRLEETETAFQYQVELPRQPRRRRFHIHIGRCRACGRRVQGRHPLQTSDALGAAQSQLGPEAQAVVVQLNKEAGLSYGKVARVLGAAHGIALTRGGAAQVVARAATRCAPAFAEIRAAVRASPRATADETGWRVGGRPHWLHAGVTDEATLYLLRQGRGFAEAAELFGAAYAGQLTHDGWAPYNGFLWARHGTCTAHLLRRCKELLRTATGGAVRFPRTVQKLLQAGLAARDRREAGKLRGRGLAVAAGRLEARLARLLQWTKAHKANERLAAHLSRHREEVFAYLRHTGLDATNWRAEQALRPAVVNRKVWGGNRTERGARSQETLMSVLRTCAQHGRDGLAFLSQVLRALKGQAPPLLTT